DRHVVDVLPGDWTGGRGCLPGNLFEHVAAAGRVQSDRALCANQEKRPGGEFLSATWLYPGPGGGRRITLFAPARSVAPVPDNASIDSVEAWDSLKHIHMVLALEQEFNVQFTDTQVAEMVSLDLIVLVLKEHGIA